MKIIIKIISIVIPVLFVLQSNRVLYKKYKKYKKDFPYENLGDYIEWNPEWMPVLFIDLLIVLIFLAFILYWAWM